MSTPANATHPANDDAAAERFWDRWERDRAEERDEEAWGAWVDALPRDEFLAMIRIGLANTADGEVLVR